MHFDRMKWLVDRSKGLVYGQPVDGRKLDLGQFDFGQSKLFRARPMADLGQFELGQIRVKLIRLANLEP